MNTVEESKFITINTSELLINKIEHGYFYQDSLHDKYFDIFHQVLDYRLETSGISFNLTPDTIYMEKDMSFTITDIVIPETVAIISLKTDKLFKKEEYQEALKKFLYKLQ